MTVAGPPSAPGATLSYSPVTASRAITEFDLGNTLQVNSASAVTLTLPNSLPVGFAVGIEHLGAGAVSFAAATGAALTALGDAMATAGTGAVCKVQVSSNSNGVSASWVLTGDTASLSGLGAVIFPIVPITTGATQTDVDPASPSLIEITTGGTAGEEEINIPLLEMDANSVNPYNIGQRITLYLKTLTDPGDTVKVLVGGSAAFGAFQSIVTSKPARTPISGLVLDFAGAFASFLWDGLTWRYDNLAGLNEYASVTWVASTNEGLSCPNGTTTISGKSVVITGDDGGSGDVKVLNLPTADPTVAGALWNSTGTLKVSAG